MNPQLSIEVRAQVIQIEDGKITPAPDLPAVGMVFQVNPPADPLLIPQLARFQTGHQLNSLARPLELLAQEAARAAIGEPAITSQEDTEAITAKAVEVSEDTLVPDWVVATATRWVDADGCSIITVGLDYGDGAGRIIEVDSACAMDELAPIIAAQIFLMQHGRLPFIGGGKMV